MFLTGGFDVFDRRFWWFWQVVLMVLTAGFDVLTVGFDVMMILTGGFCFWRMYNNDSRFWCFWWFWQLVLMVLMFWQVVLMVLMFWQQVLMVLMFWHKVFVFEGCILKSCYHDSRFCPLKTLLSGNSPPTHSSVSGSVLWKTVKASPTNICYFKTKSWLFIE